MTAMTRTLTIGALYAAAMGFAPAACHAASIPTSLGNGADTYLINDTGPNTGVAQGAATFMELRQLDTVRLRIPYIRFDISNFSGSFAGATITINGETVNRNRPLAFYGVNDGATGGQGENWDEGTLLYSDAAGFAAAADGQFAFSSDMSAMALASTAGSAVGPNTTAPSTDLEAFLAADTDGLVTFAVILEPTVNGSEDFFFSTKEGGTGLEAVLNLVPEPSSIALWSLACLLFAGRRRSA